MRFTLFDALTGGNALWTESNSDVPAVKGVFNVALGSITPFPDGLFAGGQDIFLEIAIDTQDNGLDAGDVQAPRTPVNATAVALYAPNAGALDGEPAVNFAKSADLTTLEATLTAADITINQTLGSKADAAALEAAQAEIALKADAADVFRWEVVTAGPVEMVPGRGYLVDAESEIVLTLPPLTPDFEFGDTVRVSAIGTAGWRIAQGPGQSIVTKPLQRTNTSSAWTPRESERNWISVASSADGNRLIAAAGGLGSDRLYISTDGGLSWTPREETRSWIDVATSTDGTRLVAVADNDFIYTSQDGGDTWTPRENVRFWRAVASSADGLNLIAAAQNGQLYTSTDGGAGWTPRESNREWTGLATSADGTRLAAVANNGTIYISSDSGVAWSPTQSARVWSDIASSADGTRLVACAQSATLFTSTNGGISWTARETNRSWGSVTSSADGIRLAATDFGGQVYLSDDGGLTWAPGESSRFWSDVASSADGTRLVASASVGQLYTYSVFSEQTTTGVLGGLSGGPNSAVELQYIGDDTFQPISYAGSITVN